MNRLILTFLYVAVGTSIAGDARNNYRYESVVRVETGGRVCSGFIARKNVFVTAGHCLENSKSGRIKFSDGSMSEFRAVYVEFAEGRPDFGIGIANTYGRAPLVFSSGDAWLGQFVISVGYPDRSDVQVIQFGEVIGSKPDRVVLAQNSIGGHSGSPVIDEKLGIVIGIIVETKYPIPISFATRSQAVVRKLRDLKLQ